MLRLRKLVGWGKRLAYWKLSLSLRLFFVFSLVMADFVFVKCASYGNRLVSLFTGRLGDEFVVKAVLKKGVKRGVLPVVYLFLLVVFMAVILAVPVSAVKLIGTEDQPAAGSILMQSSSDSYGSAERSFTTGNNSHGYVLDTVGVNIPSTHNAFRGIIQPTMSIYASNSGTLGSKLYDLTGDVSLIGFRYFTAPPGAVLNASTTYYFSVINGGATSHFSFGTVGTGVDSGSAPGWSMGGSTYTRNNGTERTVDGGLAISIYGRARPNSRPSGSPSISGAAPGGVVQVGLALTADTSGISDSDGITPGSFRYQWFRDFVNISGANGSTYTVVSDDLGSYLFVRVWFVDGYGYDEGPLGSAVTGRVMPEVSSISSITSDHDNNTYSPFCIGSCIISPDQDPQPSTWDGVIKIKVVFNQIVTVTGSPILNLTHTGNANDVATYDSGSGTDTLVFNYDIPSGRGGSNINVSALNLNGGTIGNSNGTASLDVPNGLNLADNKKINIDSRPPRITAYITEAEHSSQSNSIGEAIDGTGETKWRSNKGYNFVDFNFHYRHGTWVIHRIDDDNVTSCNASTLASASNIGGININNRYIQLYTAEHNGKKFCGSVADSYGNRDFSLVYIRGIDRDNPEITVSSLTSSSLVSATARDTNCGDRTDGHYSRCSGINEDKFYALPIDSGTACGGAAYDAAPGVIDDYHYTAGTMLTVAGGKKICFRVHDNLKGVGRTDYAESAVGFVSDSLPVFSSGSSFSVQENSLNVGTVTASDGDVQDSVVGYRVSGGLDRALFSITNGGVLSFRSAPDYENPADNGGNNVYFLVVEVTSGVGGRVRTATQSISVTVVDVDEVPSTPSAPVLSSPTSTSLLVSWSAPSNTGPSISGYDVGYGRNSSGPFTDWPHDNRRIVNTTITGLSAGTLYYVRVRARNPEGDSNWSETASFTTGGAVVNSDPVFSSSSSFSVSENGVGVGTVVADDSDVDDGVTGYRVSGGVDASLFDLTSAGVLSFVSAPNYESPRDNGTDNVYALEVEVTSGTGSRVKTAVQTITVTVVDVDEAPSAPGSPVLSSPSSTSLLVSWSAPSNTGPSIIDYDVGYGLNSGGPFTDWPHSGASRSATLTGLNASTLYYVRVLARNAEGDSSWSETSSFTTGSAVTNSDPVFTSSSSFSVNENVRRVGVVVASDVDGEDSVTGYRISGGVDSARFSITTAGVLTFNSAPDFESPADSGGNNVYDIVVTATSGTSGRVRTATQSVTVTVTDVDEAPSNVTSMVALSQDFGNLSSAGNTAPKGIWSIGGIMYVVDSDDYRVYAYNVSTKDFILNQSFNLSSVDAPWGIWSDNETVWVALEFSSNNDFVDAYTLSDKNRDYSKDFSMSNADFSPRGIWSDGVTMWIVQEKGNLSYVDVYKMSDTSSDSGKNFNLTVGHDSPGGVWSDGVTMWIVDLGADVVRAYNLSSGSYDSSKDFSLTLENSDPTGIWSDNETVWVADSVDDKIYSYAKLVTPVVNSPATGRPTILGTVQVGRVLTVGTSGISDGDGVPSLFSYQWVRVDGSDEDDISGATGSTYQLVSADVGKKLKVEVSFVDDGGFSEGPLASDATALVPAPVNNPPVFTSSSSFFVNENLLSVGVVVASDSDSQDSVTGYRISSSVDSALFSITGAGVLSFVSVPNYESPQDNGTDNVYALEVEVTSGTGSRVRTAVQTITVTVVDVDEAPSAPGSPVLSSPSSTSLLVSWSAPGGSGPSIIDYDVGYGRNLNGPFTDWPHSDASRSAVITGLSAGTLYYVRVLARNAEGNSSWSETASFTTVSVVVNSDPVFTSGSSFFVNENLLSVGVVVASDSDGGDSVTDYSVSGGVDRSLFSVTNAGVLTFVSAPDFESPVDVGGNNVYDLVVTATSGVGGRVRTATQTITITVTDIDEVPSTPSVPVLSSSTSTSLSVSWSAPSNTGPAINDYDVQYRNGTIGLFRNWSHADDSTNAVITGLSAGTLYQVRVLARNAEGSSSWSETASFTTVSVVVNSDPVFSSSSSFFVNENLLSVGTVVASDSDGGDSVTDYSVSGGVDSALFSITNSGVLSFVSVPDFEVPVDVGGNNVYNVVVTATSGTSGRVRTATQTITITVTDVDEVPSMPSAPVLSSSTSTSLSVSWSAPSNTGPVISDYDVKYRQGTSGSFSDWVHAGNSTSTTIASLSANTLYEVQVLARNAEGDSNWSLSGSGRTQSTVTPPTNTDPVFTSSSSFFVNENLLSVGTVVASDSDGGDSVTGYRVSGGVDSALFEIDNGGVLIFRSAPDFESPVDVGGNNVYDLAVTATSGTSGRVQTATQTITITVTDVDEVPSTPSVPVLASPSSTSLSVSWSAPSNTGPSIIDYDVGYGTDSGGPFADWPHSGAGRSAVITGLSAGTLYYVRVLARNAEGNSSWSETASFTTGSAVINSDPVFASSSSFSVNENVRRVGVVVASDSDGQDGVSGYRVSGGADRARFSITTGGVLTFVSAPDYEAPVDVGGNNVYDLVVTVTSGTGSRVRTATQSISVMVNDVDEGGGLRNLSKDVVLVYNCG